MLRLRLLFLVSLSALAVRAAHADDSPITVTATRVASPADKVPASVTILTRKDFAAKGATTLAQALTGVPGVNVVQAGGDGGQTSLFMRGTGSSDVLVLQDGVPVNDPVSANGEYNFGTLTLDDIEEIEIIRGPLAAQYGSSALGGVINIITKRGTRPNSTSVTLAGGFPLQGRVSAQTSGVRGPLDYALTGALAGEEGFDNTPQRMTSVYANHRDAYRSKMASLQLGYEVAPDTRVYAILRGQSTHSAFPDLGYPVFDDPNQTDDIAQYFGKLGVSSTLAGGRWQTGLFVARLDSQTHYQNIYDATDPNGMAINELDAGGRTDAQWNNSYRLPDAGALRFTTLTFGAEYADNTAREKSFSSYFGYPYNTFVHASQHEWAGHAGVQTTIANRLIMTGALRDDAVSGYGNAATWQLGSVLELPEIDARLKASAGTGFEAPSLFDLHYTAYSGGALVDFGNPALRPEYSLGWQVGPEFSLPLFGRDDGADLSVTYFASDMRDLIVSVPVGSFYTEANVYRAHISGVENSLTLRPWRWLTANVNYTYTHIDSADESARLRRPTSQAGASLTVTPLPRLSVTANVDYTGRFLDYVYDNNGYPLGVRSSNPGTVVNLAARYDINARFTGFVSALNLFDSRFEPVNGYQINGPSVLFGITARTE
ncbi:TonB-dependent siderophore receptor [Acidocella sp.]|uniref:TonB-dependent receptor plug domain-containing protein n=1 Tax=Acidocella sp. TaxID=50710 RepID=UPI0026252747|nr:TonB-dependent receptor [Acidocella sp.]